MSWTEDDLAAFNARRAQWERDGVVRTHRIDDPPVSNVLGDGVQGKRGLPARSLETAAAVREVGSVAPHLGSSQRKAIGKINSENTNHPKRLRKRSLAPALDTISERQVLHACMNILSRHPKVALAWRQNSGRAIAAGGQSIKFAFKGCSDLLGMLRGGRFLAVETKATGSKPSPEQLRFLQNVNEAGGLGLCVDDPAALLNALETA